MRPSRPRRLAPLLATALAGLLVAGGAALPSYAAGPVAVDDPVTDPVTAPVTDPSTPEEIAEDSLAAAEALVDGDAPEGGADADPTLVLNQLNQSLADLPTASDRRKARAILARPTNDDDVEDGVLEYSVPSAVTCRTHVCVHWVESTVNAPPGADGNPATIPPWVDDVADAVEKSWTTEVTRLGYRKPLADRGAAGTEGPTTQLDVYVGDIGDDGLYGYAASDDFGSADPDTSSAYLVLDDDYGAGQFGRAHSRLEFLQVTAAHELFHTIQYAYDQGEDAWFMEATATWMEERVYDAINDNGQYLKAGSVARPGRSLDYPFSLAPYGNWAFFEFISERMGVARIKDFWFRAAQRGIHSMLAISRGLASGGTSLTQLFTGFSAGNQFPRATYSEGGRFGTHAPTRGTSTLTSRTPGTGARQVRLDHLTSASYAFLAGSSLTGSRRLRLDVNGPSGISGAMAIVVRKDGSVSRRAVSLNSSGNGAIVVPFSRSSVSRVTLTVANTSARYTCGAGVYTCNGAPRHQNQLVTWSARAIR